MSLAQARFETQRHLVRNPAWITECPVSSWPNPSIDLGDVFCGIFPQVFAETEDRGGTDLETEATAGHRPFWFENI